MVAQEEANRRRAGFPETEAEKDILLDTQLQSAFAEMRKVFGSLAESVRQVAFIEWQRLRLRAVDSFFRLAFFLCILGFGLTASIAASLRVVEGIRSAFQTWSGAAWFGDLGAGLVVLSIIVFGGVAVRAHLRHDILRSTRRSLVVRASRLVPRPAAKS